MTRYQFNPLKNGLTPVIELQERQIGLLDCLIIHREGDTLQYHTTDGRERDFTISPASFSDSRQNHLPSDRLRMYSDGDLERVSGITGIPFQELREVRDIEKVSPLEESLERGRRSRKLCPIC